MADFEFWQRAEIKFRRLQPPPPKPGEVHHASHNGLCAWWMPGGWDDGKSYHFFNDGDDGEANRNIERLFKIAAESAGVELGHQGGESAIFAWLDRLRLEGLYVAPAATGSRIIHRVCDASAEYCLKCETEAKTAARQARSGNPGNGPEGVTENAIDPFEQDFGDRPLGDNPFQPDTAAHKAFEEATWEAKERIGLLRSKLLAEHETEVDLVDATCRYWLAHFSAVAYGRLAIVGNPATGEFYESWIVNYAKTILAETLRRVELIREHRTDGAATPFPSVQELETIRESLTLRLLRMVNHYKRAAASKVNESIQLQKAVDAKMPTEPTQTEPVAQHFVPGSSFELHKWQDLEIRFLSDERLHVQSGEFTETRNYAEFGFEDRRTKKPNLAWVTLRELARRGGIIQQAVNGQGWSIVEKRIQEIRKVFRKHFELDTDPVPFVDGIGYKASFKINCAPSFES